MQKFIENELFLLKSKEIGTSRSRKFGLLRKEPPWVEGVNITPELMYQYQITPKSIEDTLKSDFEFLNKSRQPNLVNEQLGQLLLELDIEGIGSKLLLEEPNSNTASDSSSDGSHRYH